MATVTVTIQLTADTTDVPDIQGAFALPGDARTTQQVLKDELVNLVTSRTMAYRYQVAQKAIVVNKPIIT